MIKPRYHHPTDPMCPAIAAQLAQLWDDPMTAYSGVGDEIAGDLEARHMATCPRCQAYGAENVEVR